jgi:tetratricopeptide (TPR) repeat protein
MTDAMRRPVQPAATLLADGIRYERAGVVARARDCFEAVTRLANENPGAAVEGWWRLANLHRLHSNWDDALEASRTGAALARAHGLPDGEADALNIEGAVWSQRGEFEKAREMFNRMLELAKSPGIRGKALQNLGGLAGEEGAFEEAERLFSLSREAYRTLGDARGEAISLLNIGRLQTERGFPFIARETLESAVTGARQSGDLELHAAALLNLGITLGALGLGNEAEERITTAYGQFTIADIPALRVRCLIELASLAARRDESGPARVCLTHAREVAAASELPRELTMIDQRLNALPPVA